MLAIVASVSPKTTSRSWKALKTYGLNLLKKSYFSNISQKGSKISQNGSFSSFFENYFFLEMN